MPDQSGELDEADRAYIEKARASAERLAIRGEGPDASRDALSDLEELLPVDADPPAASANPAGRLVKSAVKRFVRWYLAYLAGQVTAIGEAVLRFGSHLSDRVDELDGAIKTQTARIEELEHRVQELESRASDRP